MFNSCCKLLAQEKIKIALFESASAGYLAYRFSLSPYSGDILIGSLVSYDLRVKENTLHISSELIEKYTPKSMQVTVGMIKKQRSYVPIFILPSQASLKREVLILNKNL